MAKHVFTSKTFIGDFLATAPIADIHLEQITLCTEADGSVSNIVSPSGKDCHMYMFKWWENVDGTVSGAKFTMEFFTAPSLACALDCWYRFIRLIALGENGDAAYEVANNDSWQAQRNSTPVRGAIAEAREDRVIETAKKNGHAGNPAPFRFTAITK